MGLLSEAHSEEVDHADPFYAHCKVHSDKTLIKHRKRNYNALTLRMEQVWTQAALQRAEKPTAEQQRIERKLKKHKKKYLANKAIKSDPWGIYCKRISYQCRHHCLYFLCSSHPQDAPSLDHVGVGLPQTVAQGPPHGHRRGRTRIPRSANLSPG